MTTEEIENIVYKYGEDIYRFCRYLASDTDMAQELYQETFLKAVQFSNKIKASDNVKSYLMGITSNIWKNYIRKNARRNKILRPVDYDENIEQIPCGSSDILETFVENEVLNQVRCAIEKLPDRQRLVVILHYSENLTTEEISKILHIPKGTVLSRLSKARKILKKEMEMKGYEV